MNEDEGISELNRFRNGEAEGYPTVLHMPFMGEAEHAFNRYHLGFSFRLLPPMYIVIDKDGIIRHRSTRRDDNTVGTERVVKVLEIVEELVEG